MLDTVIEDSTRMQWAKAFFNRWMTNGDAFANELEKKVIKELKPRTDVFLTANSEVIAVDFSLKAPAWQEYKFHKNVDLYDDLVEVIQRYIDEIVSRLDAPSVQASVDYGSTWVTMTAEITLHLDFTKQHVGGLVKTGWSGSEALNIV
jgi:hypothetical protein